MFKWLLNTVESYIFLNEFVGGAAPANSKLSWKNTPITMQSTNVTKIE